MKTLKRTTKHLALLVLTLFIFINLASFVNSLGCCYSPSTGVCSKNAESSSCVSPSLFYNSSSCAISKCTKGCCTLGTSTMYTTQKTCSVYASSYGFEAEFEEMDQEDCSDLGKSTDQGACVYESDDILKSCKYTTRGKCSDGEFYINTTCSTSSLSTKCNKTESTTCYNDDVYYLDSCGNRDSLKTDCNYDSGTICAKNSATKIHECKSVDCKDDEGKTRKNGESWCSFDSTEYTSLAELLVEGYPVGSRFFRKYCLNSKVYTEPCEDLRAETCDTGKCVNNPWNECLAAGNDTESCDEEYCTMYSGGLNCININNGKTYCCLGKETDCYRTSDDGKTLFESVELKEVVDNINSEGGSHFSPNEKLLNDLQTSICLPKIPGGLDFYTSSKKSSSTDTSECSTGAYSAETTLDFCQTRDCVIYNTWHVQPISSEDGNYNKAGIIDLKVSDWDFSRTDKLGPKNSNPLVKVTQTNSRSNITKGIAKSKLKKFKSVDSQVSSLLSDRCSKISDCGAKPNWFEQSGGSSKEGTMSCSVGSDPEGKCSYAYTCSKWTAPSSGENCGECGSDGFPCSEYRCKSLGKKCSYKEPTGLDSGVCVSSSDTSSPKITSSNMTPASPIQPYTDVTFTITTDEASECKFNIDSAAGKYSEMDYDFGTGYDYTHQVTLSLPGRKLNESTSDSDEEDYNNTLEEDTEDITTYEVLGSSTESDMEYTLYVRCLDVSGNGEAMVPYQIDFKVLKTPDRVPTVIKSFSPASESSVKYNTSYQYLKMYISEPSECKWSKSDLAYESMENSFTCDETEAIGVGNNTYSCTGWLLNINTTEDAETKYYIRCEDQPWLEGYETTTYYRNTNDESEEYIVYTSLPLEISDVSPSGTIKKSTSTNLTLKAYTSGGVNGDAECKWRISNDSSFSSSYYVLFENTNSSTHTQTITSHYEGTNYVQIKCEDSAGNAAFYGSNFSSTTPATTTTKTTTITIITDKTAPNITRVYKYEGTLKVKTNENAVCYYQSNASIGCIFEYTDSNITKMIGSEKEHTAIWSNGNYYYIKCVDYYGNYPSTCNAVIKTY